MELSNQAASRAADAVTALLDGGTLRVYDRVGVELVAWAFGSPAFSPASDGISAVQPLKAARARASGAPTRFRAFDISGREILTGSVGRDSSGADLRLAAEAIVAGAEVLLLSLTYQQAARD